MAQILVTGGSGFLGQAICRALIARGDDAIAMDLPGAALDALATEVPGIHVAPADMVDTDAVNAVFHEYRPDAVIHCAAIVGVLVSLDNPALVFRVNIEGSINLFEAMVRHGVKRMIHLSSEEVYGAFQSERATEDHPLNPLHAYGITKLAVEQLGRSYRQSHGLECINLRTSWVYGPNFPRERVPCNMIKAAMRGEALHIPHGASSRIDYTYLDDAVAGTLAALDHPDHPYDVYHIGSETSPSLDEIAIFIRSQVPGAEVTVGPGNYKHAGEVEIPRKGALDSTRARSVFGYRPRFDIEAGIKACLGQFQAHTDTSKKAVQ